MKFFVSMYGHSLPVLSMDISLDGSVMVTASADKTVKLWGMDFGDCHRYVLFALLNCSPSTVCPQLFALN